jgi:hypothetical protein
VLTRAPAGLGLSVVTQVWPAICQPRRSPRAIHPTTPSHLCWHVPNCVWNRLGRETTECVCVCVRRWCALNSRKDWVTL